MKKNMKTTITPQDFILATDSGDLELIKTYHQQGGDLHYLKVRLYREALKTATLL